MKFGQMLLIKMANMNIYKTLQYVTEVSHPAQMALNLQKYFPCILISVRKSWTQGRNEGSKKGTIPRAPNHYEGAEALKVPTTSQVLSSIQYI